MKILETVEKWIAEQKIIEDAQGCGRCVNGSFPLRADAAQAVSALQHNMSALGISPKSMTNLLPPKERKEG